MLDAPQSRLGAIFVLVSILAGLCLWYGALAPAPAAHVYPETEDVLTGADRYVGDRVAVSGTVVETSPLTIELEPDDPANDPRRLTVIGADATPTTGDRLSVYGVLQDEGSIRALGTVTYSTRGHVYTYSISFLAGLWVLARIVRQWAFDPERGGLKRRHDPSGGDGRA
jgi:hypothetical protein